MQKEINPKLFAAKDLEFRESRAESRVDRIVERGESIKVESRLQQVQDQVTELSKTTTLKVERLSQRVSQLESRMDQVFQELRAKYATISGRLTERSLNEAEIEALMERHNQIIRTFENRMSQLQKFCESQQMQLMSAQASLEEARRDLARLKKL